MTSIIIPDNVKSIDFRVFDGCSGLTSIIIGNSVKSIGSNAFYGCSSLTDVYYTGTANEWKAIKIDSSNTKLTNATIHYNWTGEES